MDALKAVDSFYEVPLDQITANQDANCRSKIDPMDVLNLWKTIEKDGLIQPVTVRKMKNGYELICGFRRYMAHKVGCAKTIKARVIECSNADAQVFNLIENLERKQLNLLEEALAVQKLMFAGWTLDRIAARFNVTRGWVVGRQKLLKLPEEIQREAAAGFLKLGHIDALCKITDVVEQFKVVREIKEKHIRGEKTQVAEIKIKTPNNVAPKTARKKAEMQDMLLIMMEELPAGLHSRTLAWASGEVSTDDLMLDIKKAKFNA